MYIQVQIAGCTNIRMLLTILGITQRTVTFQQGILEGLLTRFTSPVTYLSVDPSHSHLAAASSQFTIKVVYLGGVETEGAGGRETTLFGHEAPVLCVRFDPKGEFLVSG